VGEVSEIKKIEQKAVAWFDLKHLIMLAVIVVFFFAISWLWADHVSRGADLAAAVASEKAKAADERAAAAEKTNAVFQQQTAQQIQVLVSQNQALQSQVSGLLSAIASRDAELRKQQQAVVSMAPPERAETWNRLIELPGSVKPSADGYSVTEAGALTTIQELQRVPVLAANVKDLTASVAKLQENVANDAVQFDLERKAHDSDKSACSVQLGAKDLDLAAKDAEIKKVKADAAKAKRKWFFVGAIFGEVARIFITKRP
jgi:hypothetical protein